MYDHLREIHFLIDASREHFKMFVGRLKSCPLKRRDFPINCSMEMLHTLLGKAKKFQLRRKYITMLLLPKRKRFQNDLT